VKAFWEDCWRRSSRTSCAPRARGQDDDSPFATAPPIDERAALAHLELADFGRRPPRVALPRGGCAAEPPGVGRDVPPTARGRVLRRRLRGAPRPAPTGPRMAPRWADAGHRAPQPRAVVAPVATDAPRRRVRSVLVHAWWLAVPAVAAALGWPVGATPSRGARDGAGTASGAVVNAPRRPPPGSTRRRCSRR
jgi:hypothetical protein